MMLTWLLKALWAVWFGFAAGADRLDEHASVLELPITLIRRPDGGWMATYDRHPWLSGRDVHYYGNGESTREATAQLVAVLHEAIADAYAATPFAHEEIIHG